MKSIQLKMVFCLMFSLFYLVLKCFNLKVTFTAYMVLTLYKAIKSKIEISGYLFVPSTKTSGIVKSLILYFRAIKFQLKLV